MERLNKFLLYKYDFFFLQKALEETDRTSRDQF